MASLGSPEGAAANPERAAAAALWLDQAFAVDWAGNDDLRELLALPRAIAAALIATDADTNPAGPDLAGPDLAGPDIGAGEARNLVVLDIASGPGDFLAVFLDYFPTARGVCSDMSEPMLALARDRLARYGDRVEFRRADMTNLASGDLPTGVSAVLTSRATHHLEPAELRRFYTEAAALLAPGGWLMNLDHTGHVPPWDARLRSARQRLRPRPDRESSPHRYGHPLPTIAEHLSALAQAGFAVPEIAWKAFVTCLFVARKPAG